MDRREEASGDERERRATERVSSAAAVGRGMGLGLGWGWGPAGGARGYMGSRGGAEEARRGGGRSWAAGLLACLRAVPCQPVGLGFGPSTACTPCRASQGPLTFGPGLNSGLRAGLTGSGFVPRYDSCLPCCCHVLLPIARPAAHLGCPLHVR